MIGSAVASIWTKEQKDYIKNLVKTGNKIVLLTKHLDEINKMTNTNHGKKSVSKIKPHFSNDD